MNNILALFPGQGSQQVGMGKDLYDSSDIAQELFNKADTALGFKLSELCFNGPTEELTKTAHTQPAILTVSTVLYQMALHATGKSITPTVAAGHSLGEYSALVAAGALTFEDAVLLVHKRGSYMQEAVPQGKGKMVAVLGKEIESIEKAIVKVTSGIVQAANINAPGQVVVAGDIDAVDQFIEELKNVTGTDVKAKELPVSAPFHCPLMKPAEDALRADLATLAINTPTFAVLANYFAEPLTDPERIREALALQVCGKVRWVECMQVAKEQFNTEQAIEFGHGRTLTGLFKRIDKSILCTNVNTLESIQKLST